MKTLAELSFEYMWLLMFEGEEVIDLDYSVKIQESLPDYFAAMTDEEKRALSEVAKEAQSRLLAEPDENGYTPRALVTDEQKTFMEALSSGQCHQLKPPMPQKASSPGFGLTAAIDFHCTPSVCLVGQRC